MLFVGTIQDSSVNALLEQNSVEENILMLKVFEGNVMGVSLLFFLPFEVEYKLSCPVGPPLHFVV